MVSKSALNYLLLSTVLSWQLASLKPFGDNEHSSSELVNLDQIEVIKSEILQSLGFNAPPPNAEFSSVQTIPEAVISNMFYGVGHQNLVYEELESKEQVVVSKIAKERTCRHSHCVFLRFLQTFPDNNVLSIKIWFKSRPIATSKSSSISIFNLNTNKRDLKKIVINDSLHPAWRSAELKELDAIKINNEGQPYIDTYFKVECNNCKLSLSPQNQPFIVVSLKKRKSVRKLRSTPVCKSSEGCCRNSVTVNFKDIGWGSWILAPKTYEAYYCTGVCKENSNAKLPYFQILKNNDRDKSKCCVPKSMSSLTILYVGNDEITRKDLPNMIVDECWCI